MIDVIQEIDKTLDQLICNAEAISNADLNGLSEIEIEAFQKTQESLLHHLLHMDNCLTVKKTKTASERIREKRQRFEALHQNCSQNLIDKLGLRRPIVSKRRKKRFFDFRRTKVLVPR